MTQVYEGFSSKKRSPWRGNERGRGSRIMTTRGLEAARRDKYQSRIPLPLDLFGWIGGMAKGVQYRRKMRIIITVIKTGKLTVARYLCASDNCYYACLALRAAADAT
jgi:hypothetical protein